MAIQYVGGRTQTFGGLTANTTVVNLTGLSGGIGSAPIEGDLVVIAFGAGSAFGANPSIGIFAPTDFTEATELFFASTISAANLSLNYKVMGSTPDTSVTLTGTGSAQHQGAVTVHVFRGVDAATPLDVALVTSEGSPGVVSPPAITPVTSGAWVYVAGVVGSNVYSSPNWPTSTSSDLSAFLNIGGSDNFDAGTGAGYIEWTGGTVTPATWGGGDPAAGSAYVAAAIALRPAGGPSGIVGSGSGSLPLTGSATGTVAAGAAGGVASGSLPLTGSAAGTVATPSETVLSLWLGAVTTGGITATVRTNGLTLTTRLVVSAAPDFSSPIYSADLTPDATYFFARGSVTGLAANTTYYIAAEVGGVRDTIRTGQFKTAPASGSFAFALASCNGDGSDHRVFDAIRTNNTDALFFHHMGDWSYPDITTDDVSLFHANYDLNMAQARQNLLWRNKPMVYMWDDHDYASNNSGASAPARPAAVTAYRTRVPSPPLHLSGSSDAPYYTFRVGRVVFAILDARSERSLPLLIGSAQEAWLIALMGTLASDDVLCISTGVPWIASSDNDTWFGAAAQRTRIADAIRSNIPGRAFIVAGDMHALAYDDGTNSSGLIPVLQAAALDRAGSSKGGPYSSGAPNEGPGQYGRVEVSEVTGGVAITFRGYEVNGTTGVQTEVMTFSTTLVAPIAGSASGLVPLSGSATNVTDAAGQAAGTIALTGSAAGAVLVAANTNGSLPLAGAATGRAALAGQGAGELPLSGAATGALGAAPAGAVASGVLPLSGVAAGVLSAMPSGGFAAGEIAFTGAATGRVRILATASGSIAFAGLAAGFGPEPQSGRRAATPANSRTGGRVSAVRN